MNELHYNQIEDYLKGRLTDKDLKAFEEALSSDQELSNAVALERDLIEATAETDILRLREQLRQNLQNKDTGGGQNYLKWGLLVVVGLLVILAAIFLMPKAEVTDLPAPETTLPQNDGTPGYVPEDFDQSDEEADSDRPIAMNEEDETSGWRGDDETLDFPDVETETPSEPEPDASQYLASASELYGELPYSITLRGNATSDEESQMLAAETAYRSGNFEEAILLLEDAPAQFASEAAKLRAHAQFQAGRMQDAIESFSGLRSGFYKNDAEWYLLLSHLAILPNEEAAFTELMQSIINNPNHPFQSKALQVQQIINETD